MSAADGAAPRVDVGDERRHLPVVADGRKPLAAGRGNKLVDMVGVRSGRLLVIARASLADHGSAQWTCRCDCGAVIVALGAKLRGARPRTSCGECVPRRTTAKPLGERKVRGQQRRREGVRARTVSMLRMSKREMAREAAMYPVAEHALYQRPATRADCLVGGSNAERPCPWVSCAQHLALDVSERSGSIKFTFPDREVWEIGETCALDVADRDGETLEGVGAVTNLTREAVRLIERVASERIREAVLIDVIAADTFDVAAAIGEVADSEDGSGERTDADAIRGLSELVYGHDHECGVL